MKDTIKKYLEKKSIYKNKTFDCSEIAICIPVCNEYPFFLSVLKNLAISCAVANQQVCVICCVNNKINSSEKILQNNQRMIYELNRIANAENNSLEKTLLKVCVLDYTKKNAFTEKQGVGWARKIAMDYALANGAKVLACLDADTFVDENYILQLKYFFKNNLDCGTMNFFHKRIENFSDDIDESKNSIQLNSAIQLYEDYIKNHSKKLAECGTPFCYSALGCVIVCSDKMYCECGGMKNKLAGEDFYFIQEMIKNVISKNPDKLFQSEKNFNIINFLDTTVMPSTRFSDRVLFGTGKALEQIVEGNFSKAKLFKDYEYLEIKKFIDLFNELNKKNFPLDLQREAEKKCNGLYSFLLNDGFFSDWNLIVENNKKSQKKLAVAFHCKFDGLKIIRALHYLQSINLEIKT